MTHTAEETQRRRRGDAEETAEQVVEQVVEQEIEQSSD
jgi:hypothetical protein